MVDEQAQSVEGSDEQAQSAEVPDAEAQAAAELADLLGDALIESVNKSGKEMWLRVDATRWRQCARQLRDAGFDYFGFLSAIDWSDAPEGRYESTEFDDEPAGSTTDVVTERVAGGASRFQMLMQLHSRKHMLGILVKADLPFDSAATPSDSAATLTIESIHEVFPGADWHEREAHEMFGINFAGHPNLAPIYLPTEFEGHPLRKDFPLLARQVKPWPGVVDIEEIPEHLQEQLEAEVMANFEASLAADQPPQ